MDPQESSLWDLIQAKVAVLRTKEEELGGKERLLAAELEKLHRAAEALEREREEAARVGVELETLRRGLDAREAELERQLKGLGTERGVVGERSSRVDALEKHLLERRAKLSAQEDQLTLLEEGLLGDDRDMVEQRVRVTSLEAEFLRLCTALAAALESAIQKGNALLEREAEMARQEADVSAEERDILDEAKRLASMELGLLAAPPKAASSENLQLRVPPR